MTQPHSCHSVSVVIRSHNDIAFVRQTFDALAAQLCDLPVTLISCDDASTDGTAEYIASRKDVLRVPRPDGPYKPGRTLNHVLRHATGDIIVFNNADAVPLSPDYLSELIKPLRDGRADATYANQFPRADAHPLVRKDYLRAFGDGTVAASWGFFFSLAASAAFRNDLAEHPFDETFQYSEDIEWARRRPIRIVYCPDAPVEHSHNYTRPELKKRFFGEGYAEAQRSGDVPSALRTVLRILAESRRDIAFLLKDTAPHRITDYLDAFIRRWIQHTAVRHGALTFIRENHHA